MMEKGIVDRFENEYAVIEMDSGKTVDVPRNQVSPEVKEGDAVELHAGIWQPNQAETEKRRETIKRLESELWED